MRNIFSFLVVDCCSNGCLGISLAGSTLSDFIDSTIGWLLALNTVTLTKRLCIELS